MPGVPALYQSMYARLVFTTDEAVRATDLDKALVVRQLTYLQSRRYVEKIRRGLYAIVPLESRPSSAVVSPYLVASKVARPYVLSYHTGLELHGVAQSVFYRVFVATPQRLQTFEYQGVTYQAVHAEAQEIREAAITTTVHDQPVAVATREWTVAHCALRLDLAGGLEELLKSLSGFAYLDPRSLHAAAGTLGQKVLFNRLGFILAHHRGKWHVSESELDLFRGSMTRDPSYFGAKPGRARYAKEWRLMVPDNLEQMLRRA